MCILCGGNMKKRAVYPGSFDPFTNGHLDILKRALKVFDEVIILVAVQPDKASLFNNDEKVAMIEQSIKGIEGVKVDFSSGLTIDYALKNDAIAIIRGLRAATDFEYEFRMAAGNRYVGTQIDMVFFMADAKYSFVSSSLIKELYSHGVDISALVPKPVKQAFDEKIKKRD